MAWYLRLKAELDRKAHEEMGTGSRDHSFTSGMFDCAEATLAAQQT
jgi:hypothetical protein